MNQLHVARLGLALLIISPMVGLPITPRQWSQLILGVSGGGLALSGVGVGYWLRGLKQDTPETIRARQAVKEAEDNRLRKNEELAATKAREKEYSDAVNLVDRLQHKYKLEREPRFVTIDGVSRIIQQRHGNRVNSIEYYVRELSEDINALEAIKESTRCKLGQQSTANLVQLSDRLTDIRHLVNSRFSEQQFEQSEREKRLDHERHMRTQELQNKKLEGQVRVEEIKAAQSASLAIPQLMAIANRIAADQQTNCAKSERSDEAVRTDLRLLQGSVKSLVDVVKAGNEARAKQPASASVVIYPPIAAASAPVMQALYPVCSACNQRHRERGEGESCPNSQSTSTASAPAAG